MRKPVLMTNISALMTPALILDPVRMESNIAKMARKLSTHNVQIRPHLKTSKSSEIANKIVSPNPDAKITVSTLLEAEYFFNSGYRDILYAVSITPEKLTPVYDLNQAGAKVTILLDSPEMANTVAEEGGRLNTTFSCLIEIDCDGKRAGLKASDPEILTIASMLEKAKGAEFAGVMTHAGGSYYCQTVEEIEAFAEKERLAVCDAASRLREAGFECKTVSVGSTPTATYAHSFEGVTEVRAGVYVFHDMVMQSLGVCEHSDIALSVLASVISHNKPNNRILIDAGSLALSADPGKPNKNGQHHFGQVCTAKTCELLPDLFVNSCNQEHGLISLSDTQYSFDDFPIGSKVRILPNHACITSAAYSGYHVTDPSGKVLDFWRRCNGWSSQI
ncbi:alanine racemase [Sneathiella glossodoripedis]|uniref:alanine racemase n=1 Tax=Sneathiella glossodoripedis TaxID=418853 RepID=UPI000686828C|nr:alanine racemase [Sneathiella glossodoripedis]